MGPALSCPLKYMGYHRRQQHAASKQNWVRAAQPETLKTFPQMIKGSSTTKVAASTSVHQYIGTSAHRYVHPSNPKHPSMIHQSVLSYSTISAQQFPTIQYLYFRIRGCRYGVHPYNTSALVCEAHDRRGTCSAPTHGHSSE